MAKEARLTFRVDTDLKQAIDAAAGREGRSTAQMCDAFLRAGLRNYERDGSKFVIAHLAGTGGRRRRSK